MMGIKCMEGGISVVKGVRAGGIKPGKMGLALILARGNAAGVFTRNKVIAAPLVMTRENLLLEGKLEAVIANSGNANAFTGEEGLFDAREMAKLVSDKFGIPKNRVAVASTGVIGHRLDMDWIRDNLGEVADELTESEKGNYSAATAIMTTDIVPKMAAVELESGVHIAGIAKGSGMIEPNMGTMLGFIYTDAVLETDVLDRCLKQAVDRSFNMIVVDGDTSTNDMVLLTATGALDIVPDIKEFQTGLDQVLIDLAKQIARDGEGASRLIECRVKGAVFQEDARLVSKAIVRSPLVKTAIFGQDPNWGRVIAAAGYSGAALDQEEISLTFSHNEECVELVVSGKVLVLDESSFMQLEKIMGADEVIIEVNLGMGEQEAVAWGCDLTYDYVTINAEYTT